MQIDESVTVKGSPVRSLQKFIENDLTADQRAHVLGALPPKVAERFRGPILPTETVPIHWLNLFTVAAAHAKGEKLDDFARRAGREAASDAVKGIYRFFALVLTPPALLAKAGQMWSALYNRGELRVADQSSTSARIQLVNFPSEVAGCARITGWLERMAEMTGTKENKVEHTQCYATGAPLCEWHLSWR